MYKVIIVDDEKIVRIGLKTIIKWNENGYELVGEAKDGISAFSMVQKYNPDIIITDLKMPNLDGIGLIKKLKEENYKCKVLVLSNYSDFELVKEAMKLGAVDYILKLTMQPDDLLKILNQMSQQLNKEKTIDEQNTKNQIVLNKTKQIAKNEFLKRIIEEGIVLSDDVLKEAEMLEINFGKKTLCYIYG